MTNKKKLLTVTKTVAAALWWCATIAVAVLIVGIIGAKLRGEVPRFFGFSVVNIISGSMEDEIPEGTYILIRKTDPAKIREDNIICFYSDDPDIKGYPNTHRVVKVIEGENGTEFVTKGDANPKEDPVTAKADKLIGKHVKNLDALTRFSVVLEEGGIAVISIVLTVLCAICMIGSAFVKAAQKDPEEASSEEPSKEPSKEKTN